MIASADTELASLTGQSYKLRDWLTSYPFLLVAIDPYTPESSWILETASRIFHHFNPADIRVGWLATTDKQGCIDFLGHLSDDYLTFPDPEREIVKSFELERLPSLVHIRSDGFLQKSEGWNPDEWRSIIEWVAKILAWNNPIIPEIGDPSPYKGTLVGK